MTWYRNHYEAGHQAHAEGYGIEACTLPAMSAERSAWVAGWCHRNAVMAATDQWHYVNPSGRPGAPDDPRG